MAGLHNIGIDAKDESTALRLGKEGPEFYLEESKAASGGRLAQPLPARVHPVEVSMGILPGELDGRRFLRAVARPEWVVRMAAHHLRVAPDVTGHIQSMEPV